MEQLNERVERYLHLRALATFSINGLSWETPFMPFSAHA